ncbi:chorismate mutase [Nocardiopsis quinghaiensis]|uniref:chorismate mutase n=1 Tax=Nocardiopsis quinghaiensis TaxID=464995 RepID=UPI001CC257E3|nr:chorismate mutase [Nocardiopsis quinghaiensis]
MRYQTALRPVRRANAVPGVLDGEDSTAFPGPLAPRFRLGALPAGSASGSPADAECLWFTMTPDLTADVPPLVLCEHRMLDVPMLCASEPDWDGRVHHTIRVMALARVDAGREIDHVYLDGATRDRP